MPDRVELHNWRQLLWPPEATWAEYAVMPLDPVPASAALRPRLVAAADLERWEARQIIDALAAGADASRSIETLDGLLARIEDVYEGATDIAEYVLGAPIEWWDVSVDGDTRRYVLLLYGIDCGRIYEGQTERTIASITQGALWCDDEPELWKALAMRQVPMRAAALASRLAQVAFNGAVRCPACGSFSEIWVADFADEVTCEKCKDRFDAPSAMRARKIASRQL